MRYSLTLLFILCLLTSCTKKYCWKCTLNVITRATDPNYPGQGLHKTNLQYCDKTQKEIQTEIKNAKGTKTGSSGSVTVTNEQWMDCGR